MYWPIGIANCYSISDNAGHATQYQVHDTPEQIDEQASGQHGATGSTPNQKSEDAPRETGARPSRREKITDLKVSRGGHIFATLTESTLSIWQTKPTVLLATAARSKQSLRSYGSNVALHVRPDALIIVVQTQLGFLITYSLASDPNAQVYQLQLRTSTRRQSAEGIRRSSHVGIDYGPGDGSGIMDISLRFRMVIRIDAGISSAIALDDELLVATEKPAAVQSIRWSPDKTGSSHGTELLKRMAWLKAGTTVEEMVFDRPMGLHVWLADDGSVYTVQKAKARKNSDRLAENTTRGYCFHSPSESGEEATRVAVNARFSLIVVGCADGAVRVYTAKDYLGNIPLSHVLQLPLSIDTSGKMTFLAPSPDGYAIFVGYEKGWAIWSVYGKLGSNSFSVDQTYAVTRHGWLQGIRAGFWAGGGSEMVLLSTAGTQLHTLDMARGAVTGCFAMPNIYPSLLQTSTTLMLYRGSGQTDASSISGDEPQWQTLQIPAPYLSRQWPMRSSVISACEKYVAVAGRRGLAHYSKASGRWKTFDDQYAEEEFAVRGGMCWYQHILIAAVDADGEYQLRLYSREKGLSSTSMMFTVTLAQPVIHMSIADSSSLLVYTHENVLFHYVFDATATTIKLIQVGQIGFGGIIRAPARVRSISWIVPDEQRERGEPSQDVATAAVLFLIDGKLVLLQPSPEADRELKYDMRVIAHDVEFYLLAREGATAIPSTPLATEDSLGTASPPGSSLQDSLWYFDGRQMHVWPDVHALVTSTSRELGQQTASAVVIPTQDFYPLTPIISKGILAGIEPEIVQRHDVSFAFCRMQPRAHLFIPALLQHHLSRFDSPAALHLSHSYEKLAYFGHALEVLLHDVLDREVDAASSGPTPASDEEEVGDLTLESLLPFLSSFPMYLDTVVSCARKTDLRSWTTLFRHLPPVTQLFEEALDKGALKTAGGFLLVLHTFDEESFNANLVGRLLKMAADAGEWELCRELARFLVGVDGSGVLLREALEEAGMGGKIVNGAGISEAGG